MYMVYYVADTDNYTPCFSPKLLRKNVQKFSFLTKIYTQEWYKE